MVHPPTAVPPSVAKCGWVVLGKNTATAARKAFFQDTQSLRGVLDMNVNGRQAKHRFIRFLRRYPFIALGLLIVIYLLGGFSEGKDTVVPRAFLMGVLYLLVLVVPVVISGILIALGVGEDRARRRNVKNLENLLEEDPFTLAHENMGGFKVVGLTGEFPTFTGITGDRYLKDDSATCSQWPEHVPPVSNCECGFYAFKSLGDAQFELSINPGLFLVEVDLFGLGFEHRYGYRAESQRVNSLTLPPRCMRCKTLPARIFVKSFKIGYGDDFWWQWAIRCLLCARPVRTEHKKTISQMSQDLQVRISQ